MATHLDLEEQEQLDQLKHFWKHLRQPDHLGACSPSLGAFAAWNGWQYWQRNQAAQASALYDEVERSGAGRRHGPRRAGAGRHEGQVRRHRLCAAGRPAGRQGAVRQGQHRRLARRARLGGRARRRSGLPGGRAAAAGGRAAAKPSPTTRRSSSCRATVPKEFEALVADRRATSTWPQGKRDEAKAEYQKAWTRLRRRAPTTAAWSRSSSMPSASIRKTLTAAAPAASGAKP